MRIGIFGICVLLPFALFAVSTNPAPTQPTNEWQSLCDEHRVKNWCINAVNSTDALETRESATILPMLHIFELRGEDGRFDRKTSPVRKKIEQYILQDIDTVLREKPLDTPVRLLSLGCTGLLQDWSLVSQLIRQGRTNIDLTIVDTNLVKESCEGFEGFTRALEAEGIKVKVSLFLSLSDCVKAHKAPFHAIYAINYFDLLSFRKETWGNLVVARKLLDPTGHLFLSYLKEILTIDSRGKIHVIETAPENQLLREAIVSAQHSNPRSKDCSIRLQVLSSDAVYYTAPLLYAVSDLLQDGYRDIMLYTSASLNKDFSESDLSALFSDFSEGRARLFWKRIYYIQDKREDRRDLVLVNLPGCAVENLIDQLNRDIVLLGTLVPEQGHWIVSADQLGVWDIDGKGNAKIIAIPDQYKKTAPQVIAKLFASGGCWY